MQNASESAITLERCGCRLLGISLSALQHVDDAEPQLALPM
jgi:hypothetical protein